MTIKDELVVMRTRVSGVGKKGQKTLTLNNIIIYYNRERGTQTI